VLNLPLSLYSYSTRTLILKPATERGLAQGVILISLSERDPAVECHMEVLERLIKITPWASP
jgi:hypothetical protein